jgi:DNA-binding HxlR family transcriptional regulator
MRRTRFADWDCSIARATDILGDWWTPLIVRSALLGVRRFDDFVEMLGIPRNVLTERLARLVDEGILAKVAYQERPVRHEYRLTDKGVGLYPVIVTLLEWGNEFLEWPDGEPPVYLVDRTTGERIDPVLVDARTGEPLDPRRTKAVYVRDPQAGRAAAPSR